MDRPVVHTRNLKLQTWNCPNEAPVGIEPTVGDLQSPALPLGDGADTAIRRRAQCMLGPQLAKLRPPDFWHLGGNRRLSALSFSWIVLTMFVAT